MSKRQDTLNRRELRKLRASMTFAEAREVKGLNDAGNAPCPACVALPAQAGVPCNRYNEDMTMVQDGTTESRGCSSADRRCSPQGG